MVIISMSWFRSISLGLSLCGKLLPVLVAEKLGLLREDVAIVPVGLLGFRGGVGGRVPVAIRSPC